MADTIPQHYSTEFSSNWITRVQQMKTKLDPFVVDENFMGERKRYSRMGSQSSRLRTERKATTPITDPSTDARWLYRQTFDLANTLAEEDGRNLAPLVLPTSELVQSHAYAYHRDADQVVINAAINAAITGELGTTSTAFPTSTNHISADGDLTAEDGEGTGLTLGKLLLAAQILNSNEVLNDEPRVLIVSPIGLTGMLNQAQLTSSDYAMIKPLVNGEINTIMGFTVVVSNLLPLATDIRTCVAFTRGSIRRAKGAMRTTIDRLPETSNATQIYSSWDLSAVRINDEGVVLINIDEDATLPTTIYPTS